MRGTARYVDASGNTLEVYFEGGDHVASQYGSVKSLGAWNGTTLSTTFSDAFGYRPTSALPAGMTFSYSDGLSRLCLVLVGDSVGEGRGDSSEAPAVGHPTQILPASYPHDRNATGPGPPAVVGSAIMMADAILDRGHYNRVPILSWCTGNQTTEELYGTDGSDGTYAVQMEHASAGAGPEDANPPPILRPGDDAILFLFTGTNDAADPPADYAAVASDLIARVIETDWPSMNWLAVVVPILPPSAPDDLVPSVSHPAWLTIRAAQPNVVAPGDIPIFFVPFEDADRIPGDEAHISAPGYERLVDEEIMPVLVGAGVLE